MNYCKHGNKSASCLVCCLEAQVAELEAERDIYRAGMLALLGPPDYLTEYECGHGVPLGQPCEPTCPLNPTRRALGIHGHIPDEE